YLDLCEIINLSILSKAWAILINNDIVWKKLFYKSEFLVTKVFKTYKEQYQYHYITKGYDAVVTLPLFIFQKSCRDIRAIGGKGNFVFELVNGSIKLNPVCVMHKHIKFNVTNPISVQFSHSYFNYLIKFTRDLSSFENIKLYLSKNNSSLIEFKDDSSYKSGNVKIEINNNELKFIAESELVNGSIKLNSVCVMHKHIKFNVTNPISVQFSHGYFNYLIKFIRDLTSFENIKLYLSKNNSSLIEFKDDSSFSAKGLTNKDAEGDPYVKLWIEKEYPQRTKTQVGTLEPVWNETFTFKLKDNDKVLHLKVFDSDGPDPKKDDELGETKIKLDEAFQKGKIDKTIKLPTWLGLFSEVLSFVDLLFVDLLFVDLLFVDDVVVVVVEIGDTGRLITSLTALSIAFLNLPSFDVGLTRNSLTSVPLKTPR
ncbi:10982_t:CDS:10, partial [Entrophospora sp. SA101]